MGCGQSNDYDTWLEDPEEYYYRTTKYFELLRSYKAKYETLLRTDKVARKLEKDLRDRAKKLDSYIKNKIGQEPERFYIPEGEK